MKLHICFFLAITSIASQVQGNLKYESTCETLPSEIHISKEEYDQNSNLIRTCEENVAVNKCEGSCASSTQPSARVVTGLQKDCKCCRESKTRQRTILLSSCFDSDGVRLSGPKGSLEVTLQEPMDCACHSCGK